MCLNCGSILCGRYVNGHALSHSKSNTEHGVCLNTLNSSVFCYDCDDFVINDTDRNALDDLRQEFREFDDTSSETSTYLDDGSVGSRSQQPLSQQLEQQHQLHESRSTSSSDSGCGTEEPTTPAASLPPPLPAIPTTSAGSPTTTAGRKLRPRKRTMSCDSTEAAKRKTLRKVKFLSAYIYRLCWRT